MSLPVQRGNDCPKWDVEETFSEFQDTLSHRVRISRGTDRDESLIALFNHLVSHPLLKSRSAPTFNSNPEENGRKVSVWMGENRQVLAQIEDLDLEQLELTHLPSEMELLQNLTTLKLNNKIRSIAENLRFPKLTLYCEGVLIDPELVERGPLEVLRIALKRGPLEPQLQKWRDRERAIYCIHTNTPFPPDIAHLEPPPSDACSIL